jgi:hypothetical protein
MAPTDRNLELMLLLHFDVSDLALNRQGKLSPHQIEAERAARERLKASITNASQRTPWLMMIIVIVVVGVMLVGLIATGALASLGSAALPILGGVVLLAILYLIWIPINSRRSFQRTQLTAQNAPPIETLPVYSLAGKLKTKKDYNDNTNSTYYYVIVEGKRFPVTQAGLKTFHSGKAYCLYFVDVDPIGRKALRLVSAEALED